MEISTWNERKQPKISPVYLCLSASSDPTEYWYLKEIKEAIVALSPSFQVLHRSGCHSRDAPCLFLFIQNLLSAMRKVCLPQTTLPFFLLPSFLFLPFNWYLKPPNTTSVLSFLSAFNSTFTITNYHCSISLEIIPIQIPARSKDTKGWYFPCISDIARNSAAELTWYYLNEDPSQP